MIWYTYYKLWFRFGGMKMSYFKFKDKKVYYRESGSGAPLLLLHGNTASSTMFEEVVSLYEAENKVILIDFLGHGKSERLDKFPTDLWFDEAQQVIAFLKEKNYKKVNLIGTSGGALVAINVALEAPELVNKVIADSFEGETPLVEFVVNADVERADSKNDEDTKAFYFAMHGDDWNQVVDNDTNAIIEHAKNIGKFFHRELSSLKPVILLTGSKKDEYVGAIDPEYFEKVYGSMIKKIGHGNYYLFDTGGHPAMMSNPKSFYQLSMDFINKNE